MWVVGDTPNDVNCARAINARVLAVATGIHPREDLAASEPHELVDTGHFAFRENPRKQLRIINSTIDRLG